MLILARRVTTLAGACVALALTAGLWGPSLMGAPQVPPPAARVLCG